MNYPDCPHKRTDCRFMNHGGMETMMYSPIAYDRDGKPVSGGHNTRDTTVECMICHRLWYSTAYELEDAQGKPRDWKPQ